MSVTSAGNLPNHHMIALIGSRRRASARIERYVIMGPDQLFTRLERQVITLAATNQGECEGLARDGPRQGWLARMLRGLVP
ncbi:MAG: hypothetical protein AB7K35_17370, partial [Pseudorhodoplanes sp.]